ncbi:MAG: MFS transporter [Paracoccaceae bacterium]|nr:MAG: MFS transporter [Paracoccaceae bacterium]
MIAGIAALVAAYVLSQFYRAFLAVMAPALTADLGATAEDLAGASGVWFLAFAAMQLPVGWALDRVGPRRTAAALLAAGGAGGAFLMAAAGSVMHVNLAMALIGIGCSPVLMASYYVFARTYPAAIFGTLAGATIGVGSLGNIAASLPLALAVEAMGWRGAMAALGAVTLAVAALVAAVLCDPPQANGAAQGSLRDILRIPALWLILPIAAVNYLPAAGLRGLWVGPWYGDVFGADAAGIGQVTLFMGLAMVAGNFAYGPLDRMLGTRKWLIFGGNAVTAACLFALWALPPDWWTGAILLMAVGFFGASFPMVMAHGRAFFPPHLVGRGVSFLNLFALGSVGIAQFATGRLHAAIPPDPAQAPYAALFLAFGLVLVAGLVPYLLAPDRTD